MESAPNDLVPVQEVHDLPSDAAPVQAQAPADLVPVSEVHEVQGPPEPPVMKGIFGQGELRKNAAGKMEIKIGDKFKELSDNEYDWLKTIGKSAENTAELGGGTAAVIAGSPAIAATGPWAPVAGAAAFGAGASLGKGASNIVKHILGIQDPETRGQMMDMATSAIQNTTGALAGEGTANMVGRGLSQMAQQQPGLVASGEASVASGYKAMQEQAAQRKALSEEVGGKLSADQIHDQPAPSFAKPDQVKSMNAFRTQQQVELAQKFDEIRSRLQAPSMDTNTAMNTGLSKFEGIEKAHENTVRQLIDKANTASGGKTYFNTGSLLQSWRDELSKYGTSFTPSGQVLRAPPTGENIGALVQRYRRLWADTQGTQFQMSKSTSELPGRQYDFASSPDKTTASLPPKEGGPAVKGISLPELNRLTRDAQEFANLNGSDRTPVNKSWGRIQHEARLARDEAAIQALSERGQMGDAAKLRAARGFYAENVDSFSDIKRALKNDPTNFMKVLIDPANPKQTIDRLQFLNRLDPENLKFARGAFMDYLYGDAIPTGGGKITATSIERRIQDTDPKILRALLGEKGTQDLTKLVSYGKILENTSASSQQGKGALSKIISVLSNQSRTFHGGTKLIQAVASNKYGPQDYINNQVLEYMTAPPEVRKSMAKQVQAKTGEALQRGIPYRF